MVVHVTERKCHTKTLNHCSATQFHTVLLIRVSEEFANDLPNPLTTLFACPSSFQASSIPIAHGVLSDEANGAVSVLLEL